MAINQPDEEITLESIMREFGSGSDLPPAEPVLPGMKDSAPVLPEIPDVPVSASEQTADSVENRRKLRDQAKSQRKRIKEQPHFDTKENLYDDLFEKLDGTEENYDFSFADVQQEVAGLMTAADQLPQPPEKVRTMDDIAKDIVSKDKSMGNRFRACMVVTVVNLLLSLYSGLELHWIRGFENSFSMGIISMILMICAACLSYDVLLKGIRSIGTGKFGASFMCDVLLIAAIPEAVLSSRQHLMPFAALISIELFCAMLAKQRQIDAMRNIACVIGESHNAKGVKRVEKAWNGVSAAARGDADLERFETMLEADSAQDRVMRIYSPIAVILSVLLAVFGTFLGDVSFFRLWTALLLTALPFGCALGYLLPYSLLTERLSHCKAALCGWYGAKVLHSCNALFLRDAELFPEQFLKLSGVKALESYHPEEIISYAAAILRAVRCDVASLLLEDTEQTPAIVNLRCYDEDGYSADIGADSVLLGTLGFMRKMGVHMEKGAKIRQALYLSMNGELAGIIALRYEASPEVERALHTLNSHGAPTPVLVGSDVLVSPGLLRSIFRIPLNRLAFPPLRERMVCSELVAGEEDLQGAIISEPGIETMSKVVMGARALVTAVRAGSIVNTVGGILGMAIVFMLGLSGELAVLSCIQMLGFMLIWAVLFLIAAFRVQIK